MIKILKFGLPLVILIGLASVGFYYVNKPSDQQLGVTVLKVPNGGTGASTFPVGECLKGNGTGAIVTGSCSVGSGITSLNGSGESVQYFATGTDTNLGLQISSTTDTHTFTPYWKGTLADGRIASAATWNAKQNALTFPLDVASTTHPAETDPIWTAASTSYATLLSPVFTGIPKFSYGVAGNLALQDTDASNYLAVRMNSNLSSDRLLLIQTGDGGATLNITGNATAPLVASTTNWEDAYTKRVDTWTSPLQYSGNVASITQSGTSTNGYLSSTDWNTFNNKADASSVSGKITLYHWNGASDVAGYEMFRVLPNNGTEIAEATTSVANTRLLIDSYISSSTATNGGLTFTSIPAGTWNFNIYATVDVVAGTNNIVYEIYKRASSGAETLLFTATSSALTTSLNEVDFSATYAGATSSTDGTDRLVAKVYAYSTVSGRTITFYYDGTSHYSHIETPFTFATTGYTRSFINESITGAWTFPSLTVNGVIGGSGGTSTNWQSAYTIVNASSSLWDTGYAQRLQWDGGATNLVAATGRTSLGLGTMALESNIGSTTITTLGTIANFVATNATSTNLYVSGQTALGNTAISGALTFTGSLVLPNSATLQTTATGNIGIDTTSGQLRWNWGSATSTVSGTSTVGGVLGSPVAGDKLLFWHVPYGVTILGVDCLSDNASSTSVSSGIDVFQGNGAGVATSTVLAGGTLTCLSTANSATTTNTTVANGQWLGFRVVTASGTPSWLQTTITYKITPD